MLHNLQTTEDKLKVGMLGDSSCPLCTLELCVLVDPVTQPSTVLESLLFSSFCP